MKRISVILLAALLLCSLCACSNAGSNADTNEPQEATSAADAMPLTELMDKILENATDAPKSMTSELTAESFEAYAFVKPEDGVTGVVSEAMINAIAHSVVLLRAENADKAAALAEQVQANANPRKWICVEAEKTIVHSHGNTVLLVMSFETTADDIAANFDALWQ